MYKYKNTYHNSTPKISSLHDNCLLQIERKIENWSKPLSHPRVETRSSMNLGEWRPDIGKVKLSR